MRIVPYMYDIIMVRQPTLFHAEADRRGLPEGPPDGCPSRHHGPDPALKRIVDRIESTKLIELLGLDFERGEKALICEITMKAGFFFK